MLPSSTPVALPIRAADLELNTVMDDAFFGSFTLSPQMHSHPYCEVIMCVSGRFSIDLLDGHSILMESGDLCVIPSGCIHCTCMADPNPEKLAVRFTYRQIKGDSSLYALFDSTFTALDAPLHIRNVQTLSDLLLTIRRELAEKQPASRELVQALLQQFYIGVLRLLCRRDKVAEAHLPPREDDRNSRYYTIEIWFAEHYADPVTESDMADRLGLSKRQLSRVLRDIYGMSFREKMIEIRLHNAVKLLTQTDTPVEKIASQIGYTTPSGFFTAFRKRYGMSASAYRKQYALSRLLDNRE